MDAIELLVNEHRDLEDLFDRLEEVDLPRPKRALFEELAQALLLHGILEVEHFYPGVKEKNSEPLLRAFTRDHAHVRTRLGRLWRMDPEDDAFDAELAALREEVEAHVLDEENELFPRVRRTLSADGLEELAQVMRATRDASRELDPEELVEEEEVGRL